MYFSTTGMIWRPIFLDSIAISMYSSSLNPLQMIGRFVVGDGEDGQQFGLRAGFEAELVGAAVLEYLLHHLALLVDLDRDKRSSR